MESIYPPDNFGATNNFPLQSYFEDFSKKLPSRVFKVEEVDDEDDEMKQLIQIQTIMGISLTLDELTKLSESCSINHLTCPNENTKDFPIELPEDFSSSTKLPLPYITPLDQENLLEVHKCKNDFEKKKPISDLLTMGYKRTYPKRINFPKLNIPRDIMPGQEFIISILIYRPFAFNYFNAKNNSEKLRFNHEILALGSNTLTEIRDTIICSADDGLYQEVENTSDDLKSLSNARAKYPSAFIFIDNIFYNDFREPDAVDYSYPIIEWAKEKNIGRLQKNSIENVQIKQLKPRFGYPYVYMHQGDCEHLLVFSDARLLKADDCLHSQCYPHVSKQNRSSNRMCLFCSVSFAKWICIDGDRFPQNKVFLCTDCCNSYNYLNGEKVGNFKLYPYYEKHVVI